MSTQRETSYEEAWTRPSQTAPQGRDEARSPADSSAGSVTKAEFTEWLQDLIDAMRDSDEMDGGEYDAAAAWWKIEDESLLDEIGAACAMDYYGRQMFFRLSDGFLTSGYEYGGADGETIWFFPEWDVTHNLREVAADYADIALGHARAMVHDLEALLR